MNRKHKFHPGIFVLVCVMLVISLFPLFYLIVQSFAPAGEINRRMLPTTFTLDNYKYLVEATGSDRWKWVRAFFNSFIVCIPTGLFAVVFGVAMGYALTKVPHFRGKRIIINSLLFQMFFPTIMLLVPKYLILKGLANSYPGMIVPFAVSLWAMYMYYNYFRSLPNEMFEAARLDGAGHLKMIWHVAIPATRTVTVIVFLTVFMTRWNELMWDMVISPNARFQTLNVLVTTNMNAMKELVGPMYAASCVLVLPVIIMFLVCSKYFTEGIDFMLK